MNDPTKPAIDPTVAWPFPTNPAQTLTPKLRLPTSGVAPAIPERHLSFGQRAVGLTFNPSQDADVYEIKRRFAELIDGLDTLRHAATSNEVKRMASVAITEAQASQMWAVKAVTWAGD